jgi:hypothetical protein
MTAAEDASELSDSSTTDLSFDPAILAGAPHSGGKGKRATGFVPVQQHTGDTTFLSMIEGDRIEQLRKRIEEEYLAKRQREAEAEKEVTGYGVRRRSFTGRSRASSRARSVLSTYADGAVDESAIEETTAAYSRKDDTMATRTSRASHRRRSSAAAFTEMTSAFIIPDITIPISTVGGSTKDVLASLKASAHDTNSCSICQRILSSSPSDISIKIPIPVPVTQRKEYREDIDATLRPAQTPATALARVVKELSDELVHLKLQFSVLTTQLKSSDPAVGARKSMALHKKIERLNKMIRGKGEQLYALFDVVEAHKDEMVGLAEGEGEELPEEVERTLENVLKGRRVGFESEDDDEGEMDGSEWPGISDTEGL